MDSSADDFIVTIDRVWSDNFGIGVQGWALSRQGAISQMQLQCAGGAKVQVTQWHDRPDVQLAYAHFGATSKCGFMVYLPRVAEVALSFEIELDGVQVKRDVTAHGQQLTPHKPAHVDAGSLFDDFISTVNTKGLDVLELGSRIVSPGSSSKRPLFPGARSFTGFDFHPDANTDVVGDAHRLSSCLERRQFDAVFSVSVLEHIAMPWVVAMEINKVLRLGGVTFHATHFAWPAHDQPWDYWRFSDEALKSLFSRPLGFKTIKAGLFAPLRMYPDTVSTGLEGLAFNTGFGGSAVLAEKTSDLDGNRLKWDVSIEDLFGHDSQYPLPV